MLLSRALLSTFLRVTQLPDKALHEPSEGDYHRNTPTQRRLLFRTSPYTTFINAVFPTVCSAVHQSYAPWATGLFSLSPCHALSSPISRLVVSSCLPHNSAEPVDTRQNWGLPGKFCISTVPWQPMPVPAHHVPEMVAPLPTGNQIPLPSSVTMKYLISPRNPTLVLLLLPQRN